MNVTLRMVHLIFTVYVYLHRASQHEGKKFQLSCLESDRRLEGDKEREEREGGIFNPKN